MTPYKTSLQEDLRKRICQFRNLHLEKPKMFTVKHFLDKGASKATIYRALERVEKNIGYQRKKGCGWKAIKMDKKHIDQLKKTFDHHHGVSQRQVARRFNCVQSYISKILKDKTNIRYYKKKKIPHRSESQLARIKPLCRHIYRNFRNFDFVLDDESYFTYANTTLAGNDGFYSSDVSSTTSDVKFKRKKKYEEKVLVSLIISPKGTSKPMFFESGLAINKQSYIECLRKRLIPFIDKHYKNEEYLFWPDLASSHYANEVIAFLDSNNIKYVPKVKNPPNVPEARPIEDFWG